MWHGHRIGRKSTDCKSVCRLAESIRSLPSDHSKSQPVHKRTKVSPHEHYLSHNFRRRGVEREIMLFTALQNRLLNFLQIGGFSAAFLKITFNAASVGDKSSMRSPTPDQYRYVGFSEVISNVLMGSSQKRDFAGVWQLNAFQELPTNADRHYYHQDFNPRPLSQSTAAPIDAPKYAGDVRRAMNRNSMGNKL
jgi:hypothetical protein